MLAGADEEEDSAMHANAIQECPPQQPWRRAVPRRSPRRCKRLRHAKRRRPGARLEASWSHPNNDAQAAPDPTGGPMNLAAARCNGLVGKAIAWCPTRPNV